MPFRIVIFTMPTKSNYQQQGQLSIYPAFSKQPDDPWRDNLPHSQEHGSMVSESMRSFLHISF
jgi:hypothetical protein